MPPATELEVTTICSNLGECLRDTGVDVRAVVDAAASDHLENVIDAHTGRVLSGLTNLPHGALVELLETQHEVWNLAHLLW